MPDSVGGGGFPNNINSGHEHLDQVSGFTYQYQGGSPVSSSLNWKIIDGVTPTPPSTSGWGSKQLGAKWFNSAQSAFKGWNGTQIVTFMTLEEQIAYFQSQFFVEDDFATGSGLANLTGGQLGWGVFTLGAAGTVTNVAPVAGVDNGRVGIVQLNAAAGGAGNGVDITMSQIGNYTWQPDLNYDITWVVRPVETDTDTLLRIGVGFETNLEPPTLGNYFEKAFADTNWFAVTNDASITRVDTGVPYAAQWMTARIRRTSASNIRFTIGGVTKDISTDLSGGAQSFQAFALIKTNSASAKTARIDYCALRITDLVR